MCGFIDVVNHSETLELGELPYLAGMVWGRWLAAVRGLLGTQAKGQSYLWTQVLE